MELIAKPFEGLSTTELYEIIKSRNEVFLLEQHIICQDLDDVDYRSIHCFYRDGHRVVAYLRAFYPDDKKDTMQIGRVLTLQHGKGTGKQLMADSMTYFRQLGCKTLTLYSQTQAIGFYEKCGFVVVSEEFLEEGVPHVTMERTI